MPPVLTVRILGAGVSGLASAIRLAADGHRVELVDESFTIPAVGTALVLFSAARRALERLGCGRRCQPWPQPPNPARCERPTGASC